jgi:hypothetical protein
MRIIELRPEYTAHKAGKTHRASSWRGEDWHAPATGTLIRYVFHYQTLMVRYESADNGETWTADDVSIGHGSVSDQNGVNQLTSVRYIWQGSHRGLTHDYGWRYSRRGGASVDYIGPEASVSVRIPARW